jgi:large subunit ribosomal protein L24
VPARIRTGDTVIAIAGKDKGRTGTVLEVRPSENRAVVEGLNIVKRHTRPRPPAEPGGVIEKPAPIHLSNLALVDPDSKGPTRVRFEEHDGRTVRVAVKSGKRID